MRTQNLLYCCVALECCPLCNTVVDFLAIYTRRCYFPPSRSCRCQLYLGGVFRVFSSPYAHVKTWRENTRLVHSKSILEVVRVYKMITRAFRAGSEGQGDLFWKFSFFSTNYGRFRGGEVNLRLPGIQLNPMPSHIVSVP